MGYIELISDLHDFKKVNLTTLSDNNGSYDLYRCSHCGLEGKRYGLSNKLLVDVTLKKVKECDGRKIVKEAEENTSKLKVKITQPLCIFGAKDIKVGDIVEVVRKDARGLWIKGQPVTEEMKKLDPGYNGEILIFRNECEVVTE